MSTTIFPPPNPADDDYIRRGDLLIGSNLFYAPPDRSLKTGPFVQGGWAISVETVYNVPAADVRPVPEGGIGEMSDGYHTFNGLYYQRMILFAALVKAHKDKAWKSHRHEDGELCFGGGWFIVGIDTPDGSYTYHYEDKDWDRFDCQELPTGKKWDGHTEADVTRLLSLPDMKPVVRGKWVRMDMHKGMEQYKCAVCRYECYVPECMGEPMYAVCPNCGADMREDADGETVVP